MRQLCKQLNIEPHVTPYELHHTAISLQAETGQTPWNIADWAGSSEKIICDTYRHRLTKLAQLRPVGEQYRKGQITINVNEEHEFRNKVG